MEFFNDLFEIIAVKMSINFGGGDRLMAQHFLNSPQIGTTFTQVGSKRMAESMRTDGFLQSNFGGKGFDD